MIRMILIAIIALPLFSIAAHAKYLDTGYPKIPKCPAVATKEVWQKNYSGCMDPFVKNKVPVEMSKVRDICTCIADGIVNSQTCEEIDREKRDAAYKREVMEKIEQHCMRKFPLQDNDLVADEASAIRTAEYILETKYGKSILEQRPFKVKLRDGVWTVTGSMNCPSSKACKVGVTTIELYKRDGTIKTITNGK